MPTRVEQTLTTDDLVELAGDIADGDPLELVRCNLSEVTAPGIELPETVFTECVLDGADLRRADLTGARMVGGSARATNLLDAELTDLYVQGVDAAEAVLTGARLTDAEFHGCKLTGLIAERTAGMGVLLRGCNAFAAELPGIVLARRDHSGTRFTEANLSGADLREAVLDSCTLHLADLTGADLTGADLRGAELGPWTTDTVGVLAGAIISPAQAISVATDISGVTVLE